MSCDIHGVDCLRRPVRFSNVTDPFREPASLGQTARGRAAGCNDRAAQVESIGISGSSQTGWQWRADGQVLSMRQGGAYQPTVGTAHINHYIDRNQLDLLYAQLLPDAEAKRISPTFQGADHGRQIQRAGLSAIRLYQAPLENDQEIARFKQVMRRAYELYGLRVYMGDFLGLYDPKINQDRAAMERRVRRLARLYGSEPWLACFSLGNENETFLPSGPVSWLKLPFSDDEYYAFMDHLAGVMKHEENVRRPIFLGHAHPGSRALEQFSRLSNVDGLGLNLYARDGDLERVLQDLQEMNRRRVLAGRKELPVVAGEFGQLSRELQGLNEQQRAHLFSRQADQLDRHPAIAGRFVFELTDERWKVQDEGPFADQYGILGRPALEQVFAARIEKGLRECRTNGPSGKAGRGR